MNLQTIHLADVLAANSGIDAGYRHSPKHVAPGEPIELPGTLLKWYGIHYEGSPIPESVTAWRVPISRRRRSKRAGSASSSFTAVTTISIF